jgi:hypothetical protein
MTDRTKPAPRADDRARPHDMTTIRDLLDGPPMLPLWPDVAGVLDIGKTRALELAAAGELPVKAIRLGARWMVPTAPLLRYLGVRPPGDPEPAEPEAAERSFLDLLRTGYVIVPVANLRKALRLPGDNQAPALGIPPHAAAP